MFTEWHTEGSRKQWPNGIPNGIPNHLTGGLPNDYREANGYSTEAAYRDGRREVDQEVYHEVDRQSLPSRPRFTETPALLESASARRLSLGEKDQGEKSQEKIMREARSQPRYPPRCPQSCAPRSSLPICLIPHEDYRYCMKHAEALYEGSEEHKHT
jgi:hypothetical protein